MLSFDEDVLIIFAAKVFKEFYVPGCTKFWFRPLFLGPQRNIAPNMITENDTSGFAEIGYAWTTGNDPAILHRRLIDSGGSGEVHEVSKSLMSLNLLVGEQAEQQGMGSF